MRPLFIDTGYLLVLELANDQNHAAAKQHWQSLLDALPPLITTSYVFDETVTFFNSRGYHAKAVEVGHNLLYSPSVQLIHIDEAFFQAGWRLLQLPNVVDALRLSALLLDTLLDYRINSDRS